MSTTKDNIREFMGIWQFGVILFSLMFNGIVAAHIVPAVYGLFRGQFQKSQFVLLSPHWIAGIVIPVTLGYINGGVGAVIAYAVITVSVPYAAWLYCYIKSDYNVESSGADEEQGFGSGVVVHDIKAIEAKKAHVEHQLIVKKVVQKTNVTGNPLTDENGKSKSFRSKHPKTDLYIRRRRSIDDDSSVVFGKSDLEESHIKSVDAKSCSICLEAYEAGEDIARSKNPHCHHVFHKECLVDYLTLTTNDNCPICRRSFDGGQASGEGEIFDNSCEEDLSETICDDTSEPVREER